MILKNNKGFTLIELLIYVGIFALVSGALVSFIITIINISAKNYVVQEVNSNSRLAIELISERIRSAADVNEGLSTFDADPGVLSLAMDVAGQNPTIIDLTADDGRLQIKEGVDPVVYLTTDEVKVTDLQFKNITTSGLRNSIQVQMTIEYADPSSRFYEYTKTLQTTITLRK